MKRNKSIKRNVLFKMLNIKNIFVGWKNYLTDDEIASELAQQRAKHCAVCPHAVKKEHLQRIKDSIEVIEGFVCELCSCPLSAKLRAPEAKCDIDKW